MRSGLWGFVFLVALFPLAGNAGAQTIRCASADGGKAYCPADTQHGVRLVKQRSEMACKQNESWGYDEKGIWVDHGCDGDFALGPETVRTVTCASPGGERKYCDASTGRGVRLAKQLSEAPCKKGDSWDYDGLGIWVDKGCSAEFALGGGQVAASEAKEQAEGEATKEKSCLKQVGKARADQLVKQCLQVSPATQPPCNAQNSCELIEDEIRRSCGLLGPDAPGFCGGYK